MTTVLFDEAPFHCFVISNWTRWPAVSVMPTRSKNERYILTTRPLKTAEDFCNASAAVAGAMQVHAYAGSMAKGSSR